MKIAFLPIDNRPVCYTLAKDIAGIDREIEFFIPPRKLLGDLKRVADIEGLISWLENLPQIDSLILSLDTLVYGGLIPSRRSKETLEELQTRLERIKPLLRNKNVYAFSSIMRISNNNYNEEEKEYWSEYGKKIFDYSFSGGMNRDDIPDEIIEDYLSTRKRNFTLNKTYLNWQKEGLFNTLIFSKDDCAEKGFNVEEAKELERLGGKTKTGADEIPLALLARAIKKEIKIYPEFLEPEYKNLISNYEDVSIEKSVSGQLELCGFKLSSREEADVILIVNNFKEKQGELVMGWKTQPFDRDFVPPNRPYCVADVRFANGGDNAFVEQLLNKLDLKNFYGYAGWNTSANTLGSLLCALKVKWNASQYDENAFKKFATTRLLDDWAYQANVRAQISEPTDIKQLMKPYENRLSDIFNYDLKNRNYSYPWQRRFEIEVSTAL
ncbi:DUF4127 family protein [bacterium]|nr:DUF4127 family protein [bacterium]